MHVFNKWSACDDATHERSSCRVGIMKGKIFTENFYAIDNKDLSPPPPKKESYRIFK